MNGLSDAELMALTKKGETSAFAILVQKYQNVLLNFFLRKSVSYNDGQDLAQQTFLRLWNYRKRYEPQAKFTTFLFLLAGQVSVDFYRTEARRRNLVENLTQEADVRAAGVQRSVLAEGDDVRRAVARLPEGLRDVVELGVFQDLPYVDISDILGIPVGTVKSRMFNALRKLKEFLG